MPTPSRFAIDADFPGGNILIRAIDGDVIRLQQDLRDTEGFWFYWCFRVRGAAGRELTFRFPDHNLFSIRGPAVSTDRGATWQWTNIDTTEDLTFRWRFDDDGEVRFSMGQPYVREHLDRYLAGRPAIRREALCETPAGRRAELLRVGCDDGPAEFRLLLTCRHHCCEMMASYVLEGLLDAVIADDDLGRWFRERVAVTAVPFVDVDGVEQGDQGKSRRPHDHNRDYIEGLYAETRAIRELVEPWTDKPLVCLDLHCPYIRDTPWNDRPYFVGPIEPVLAERLRALARAVGEVRTGPISFSEEHFLAHGQGWNTFDVTPDSFGRWSRTLGQTVLSGTLEMPYADAVGVAVTPETARAFGRDLAAGLQRCVTDAGPF